VPRLPKLDFTAFCAARGVPITGPGRGQGYHIRDGWLGVACVFCGSGGKPHLAFSLSRGSMACWRCGGHSAWSFVAAVLGTKRRDLIAAEFLRHARPDDVVARQVAAARAEILKEPPNLGGLARRHRDYLRGRRFRPGALAAEWGLRGTRHLSGDWSWRVCAPIRDAEGRPVAWVGRSIRAKPKYRYKVTPDSDCLIAPEAMLYGIDRVPGDAVIVVEGPADVWRLGPGAVATLGVVPRRRVWCRPQAMQLRAFSRRYVMYDSRLKDGSGEPDRDAQRRARGLAEFLSQFPGTTEVVDDLPCDPGDLSAAGARQIRRALLGRGGA